MNSFCQIHGTIDTSRAVGCPDCLASLKLQLKNTLLRLALSNEVLRRARLLCDAAKDIHWLDANRRTVFIADLERAVIQMEDDNVK